MSEPEKDIKQAASKPLRCVVITPIGPGHEVLATEAYSSVEAAFRNDPGPFAAVISLPLPDLDGEHGRSQRRNDGIDYALANGFDWIFFLDADDLMAPDAFGAVVAYLDEYDAIFGMIAETRVGGPVEGTLRPNQLEPTTKLIDILRTDPFLSLQMGHFVRTEAAAAIRFDSALNIGEDFKYYLQLWSRFRCAKIDRVLFVNRRGAHSGGPRSGDGGEWRTAVKKVFMEYIRQSVGR
jgi:glycosyltransferase involved in cell wall biosynthesis